MNDIAILYHSLGMLCAFGLGYYLRGISLRRVQRDPVSRELPMTRQEARRRAEHRAPVVHTPGQRNEIRRRLTEEPRGE